MEQKNIKGQAFRVLTDAANGIFHRVSLWTHADDVEMDSGDSLTVAMNDKYNISKNTLVISTLNDIEDDTFGQFVVNEYVGSIVAGDITLRSGRQYEYGYMSFHLGQNPINKVILVFDVETASASGISHGSPLYIFKRNLRQGGWTGSLMTSKKELDKLQDIIELQIAEMEHKKYGYNRNRLTTTSLDDIPMNEVGTAVVTETKAIGHHDDLTNITTYIIPGEYTYWSYENLRQHKTIFMVSNSKGESGLTIGGAYLCTNTGVTGAPWIITRMLSATDFSTDETGMREQIVASLTGQLWPVGSIYLNLTRENPGNFLGGTWNLITEGILTAIKGSAEQAGYHQRDLYKAVRDEDRGEHLYGVFAWQRIA